MTSTELKHQVRLQEWVGAIQDCRSSGLSVRQWCRERETTPTTYYRWERELLSVAGSTKALPETPTVAFAELPVPKQVCCSVAERSATLQHTCFGTGNSANATAGVSGSAFVEPATDNSSRSQR